MLFFIGRLILVVLIIPFIFSHTITSVSAQISTSQVLFYDNFSDNLIKWRIKHGTWYIDQGNLINKSYDSVDQPSRIETGEENWDNFRLELELNNFDGIDSGIGFRKNNSTNSSYELTIRHGSGEHGAGEIITPQIFLQKVYWNQPYTSVKSSKVLRDNRSFPLLHNRWYHIKIEVFNRNIKIWIDNNLLFDFTDDSDDTKSGFITLATWTGKFAKINVAFDNVKITALGPEPFLDLPWDYEAQGSTFNYMALDPYSWFDHEYPLQDQCCNWQVMTYAGQTINRPYRSHNGYDYSRKNGIRLNTPVLAAATGSATFKPWNKTGGAGNMIKIDHGNGYQTWYEHLSVEGLITSTEGQSVDVEQGDQIGLVGMTGNTDGPHIHFSVFKETNNNNSFDDEIPYGVTDPLGWDGEITDPWSIWSNGARSGTSSYNMFYPASFSKSIEVPIGGGILSTKDTTISIPQGTYNGSFKLVHKIGPFVSLSDYTTGVTPSFSLNAYKNGQLITSPFIKPIQITIDYSKANLTNIDEGTIRIRHFNEQSKVWEELPINDLNTTNNTISTQINHFSRFAVVGNIKDLIPPTTAFEISGDKGLENWYRTPVEIRLPAQDNEGGVELEYTLYTINGNDWFEYLQPLIFGEDGNYQITYQSYDKAENQEERKTIKVDIDKTKPTITINSPKEDDIYILNQTVISDWQISDNLSGIDTSSTEATVASGKSVGTSTPGKHIFTVKTKDLAGNESEEIINYTVRYNFSGLNLPPLKEGKNYKQGSTIPIKFQSTDYFGKYMENVQARLLVDDTAADSSGKANANNLFRYDPTSNQYIFNLSTLTLAQGNHMLKVSLDEGKEYESSITIR